MLQHCFEASQVLISVNSDPLEPTAAFSWLGRTVAYNNSYWSDLYHTLQKAGQQYKILGKVVMKMGSTVKVQELIYKSTVQLVFYKGEIVG